MSIRTATANDLATTATSLSLDTPAQTTPNAPIAFMGTYQGNPQALDYNLGNGTGWLQATNVTFTNGTFSFTVPGGLPANTYTLQVRDHTAQTISSSAGNFVVSAWTPETLTSSTGAKAVFEFNPNSIAGPSGSAVSSIIDSADPTQSLSARLATNAKPISLSDGAANGSNHRLLQFQATNISPNSYDPTTNWLSAGGSKGSANGLLTLADSSNLKTNGSFTTVIAIDINSKQYDYEAGPIWGSPAVPGPLQYIQLRENPGSGYLGANLSDSIGTAHANAEAKYIPAGYHVLTMIKGNGTLTYRLDGKQLAQTVITSTDSFKSTDFMIGGGYAPAVSVTAAQENGVPPPFVGEFQAYSGMLSGTDLANAEKLAGNSVGLSLSPVVPPPVNPSEQIAVGTPTGVVAGQPITVTGTYTGGPPVVLDEEVDGGAYVTVAAATIGGGNYSFTLQGLAAGTHTIGVRDDRAQSVSAVSAAFSVSAAPPPPPASVVVAQPSTLVAGQDTFKGIVTGGTPSVVKFAWHGSATGETASAGDMVIAAKQSDGSYSATLTIDHLGSVGYFYVAVDGVVTREWSAVPVAAPPSPGTPTIALSAPGTVQESTVGAGVTVTETITTANLAGPVYLEVLTSNHTVETAYSPVTLTNGTASPPVHFAHSGDFIQVVDNLAAPTVTKDSAPVTITDPVVTPPGGPAVVTVPQPATLVAGQDSFTGVVTSGTPTLVKFGWHGPSGETATSGDLVTATKQADGSYSATLTVDHPGQTSYLYVDVDGVVTREWGLAPVAAPVSGASAPVALAAASQSVAGSMALDMTAKANVPAPASPLLLPGSSTSGGTMLALPSMQTAALIVPDHLKLGSPAS